MPDITLSDAVNAFNECEVSTGTKDLSAKITTDLVNNGANTESIAQHARLESKDAACVVGALNGEKPETGMLTNLFNKIKSFDPIKDAKAEFKEFSKGYDATARTREAMRQNGI